MDSHDTAMAYQLVTLKDHLIKHCS